ncbi:hypothetical protein O181_078704 [Austropuccinia psidii MF-1]|uniref:Uncharacterized protein n=1 Tax=Austropuccinia psidii MF-1 TaxID=1389203 RepID=A0A9Q3IHJ4_9BASI|nr:hypothetical protein [Austropuccinia psidii MF-1]
MANWSPVVPYGHLAISCHHWPPWPISISPTPRPLSSRGLQAPYGSYSPWAMIHAPKPQLDPPEPKLAKDLLDTNLAINPVGPICGHGLWQPPEATRSAQSAFPSTYGEFFPFLHTIRT